MASVRRKTLPRVSLASAAAPVTAPSAPSAEDDSRMEMLEMVNIMFFEKLMPTLSLYEWILVRYQNPPRGPFVHLFGAQLQNYLAAFRQQVPYDQLLDFILDCTTQVFVAFDQVVTHMCQSVELQEYVGFTFAPHLQFWLEQSPLDSPALKKYILEPYVTRLLTLLVGQRPIEKELKTTTRGKSAFFKNVLLEAEELMGRLPTPEVGADSNERRRRLEHLRTTTAKLTEYDDATKELYSPSSARVFQTSDDWTLPYAVDVDTRAHRMQSTIASVKAQPLHPRLVKLFEVAMFEELAHLAAEHAKRLSNELKIEHKLVDDEKAEENITIWMKRLNTDYDSLSAALKMRDDEKKKASLPTELPRLWVSQEGLDKNIVSLARRSNNMQQILQIVLPRLYVTSVAESKDAKAPPVMQLQLKKAALSTINGILKIAEYDHSKDEPTTIEEDGKEGSKLLPFRFDADFNKWASQHKLPRNPDSDPPLVYVPDMMPLSYSLSRYLRAVLPADDKGSLKHQNADWGVVLGCQLTYNPTVSTESKKAAKTASASSSRVSTDEDVDDDANVQGKTKLNQKVYEVDRFVFPIHDGSAIVPLLTQGQPSDAYVSQIKRHLTSLTMRRQTDKHFKVIGFVRYFRDTNFPAQDSLPTIRIQAHKHLQALANAKVPTIDMGKEHVLLTFVCGPPNAPDIAVDQSSLTTQTTRRTHHWNVWATTCKMPRREFSMSEWGLVFKDTEETNRNLAKQFLFRVRSDGKESKGDKPDASGMKNNIYVPPASYASNTKLRAALEVIAKTAETTVGRVARVMPSCLVDTPDDPANTWQFVGPCKLVDGLESRLLVPRDFPQSPIKFVVNYDASGQRSVQTHLLTHVRLFADKTASVLSVRGGKEAQQQLGITNASLMFVTAMYYAAAQTRDPVNDLNSWFANDSPYMARADDLNLDRTAYLKAVATLRACLHHLTAANAAKHRRRNSSDETPAESSRRSKAVSGVGETKRGVRDDPVRDGTDYRVEAGKVDEQGYTPLLITYKTAMLILSGDASRYVIRSVDLSNSVIPSQVAGKEVRELPFDLPDFVNVNASVLSKDQRVPLHVRQVEAIINSQGGTMAQALSCVADAKPLAWWHRNEADVLSNMSKYVRADTIKFLFAHTLKSDVHRKSMPAGGLSIITAMDPETYPDWLVEMLLPWEPKFEHAYYRFGYKDKGFDHVTPWTRKSTDKTDNDAWLDFIFAVKTASAQSRLRRTVTSLISRA